MAASQVAYFKTNFFRIAVTPEAETQVSGKTECVLATGKEDRKQTFWSDLSFTQEKITDSQFWIFLGI